jgi:flagellar motor switch protein FliM
MDDHDLTAEELALLHSGSPSADGGASDVREQTLSVWGHGRQDPLDLRRQLEALESFHQDVASRFADALSRGLQRLVEVELIEVGSMAYSQFAFGRANPTCYVVLQAAPLATPLALDLSPGLLFPILDCLLGGGQRPCPAPSRPPTELEQRLARRVIRMLLDELHDAWEPLLAVDLSIDRIESHAQRVRVVAPGEAVATMVFRARVAEQTGEMTWCLPLRAIRKIVDKLLVGERRARDSAGPADAAGGQVHELVAYFDAEAISSVELDNLREGDVILSDLDAEGLVEVAIDGQHQFRGRPGVVQGQRAVVLVNKSA